MSFKKQFPSLNIPNNGIDFIKIKKELMAKNCLDKQKVREAIMKHCDCSEYHIVDNKSLTCLDMVLEELGL